MNFRGCLSRIFLSIGAILGFIASAMLIKCLMSGYSEYVPKMECPTATDRMGNTIPAYQRHTKGIYIIKHCDGTLTQDTIK